MKRMKWIVICGLLIGLGALTWLIPNKVEQSRQQVEAIKASNAAVTTVAAIGKDAPDFRLQALSGEDVRLSDFKGKTVILNFWTTWCTYCKKEIPELINFHHLYKKEEVVVIAVNLSSEEENIENVAMFAKEFEIPFLVPLDKEGDVGKAYQIIMIPTTFIINPDGKIQNKIMGPVKLDQLKQQLKGS